MTRMEFWILHISSALLTVTGVLYFIMHYFITPVDPFSVVNHPLEPYMMKVHILAAPVLLVAIGLIAHTHILWKLHNNSRTARRSGISLIPIFLLMTFSGYLLQVMTSPFLHKILVGIHLASGLLWLILYVSHQVASLSLRRAMSRANAQLHRG